MTYVEPAHAANLSIDSIYEIRRRSGAGNWRVPVAASSRQRVLLYQWLPGTASDAHAHPDADEIFVLHEGQASFELGEGKNVNAEAGSIIYVPAGQRHSTTATGQRPLLMMIVVAPNAPDDAMAESR